MHRSTPSPLLPLLLSSLLSLHHLTSAGGSGSPDDFNLACITAVASFPERQDTVAFLDAYDSSSDTMTVFQVGWMWIDNGVCDNSLIICSNFSSADSNQLQIQSFSFSPGQNDPVHVETSFMCEMCPACVLRIDVFSDSTTIETVNINCDGSAQTNDLTQNEDFVRVQYSVTFDNSSTATQCVTIDSYRIWQYQDCPATVFQLANYQQTDPGIGPVDSTGCVANAQSDGTARAGCSGDSVWGTVVGDSAPCNCLAGFTPNNDLTACEACGAGLFKATVGNEQCEPCTNGQVPNSGRTGCGCAPGYTGPSCGECVENFFMTSGGACDPCPSGSVREVGHEMTSCTCTGNLVNDESSPTTICSMCATGYYRESSKSPSEPCNCEFGFSLSIISCVHKPFLRGWRQDVVWRWLPISP
ncbi:Ephrin type-B receptor 3, partial [Geodia barretti]